MDWFYAQNNRQIGPVTQDALIAMLQQGHVLPSDLVWREGMGNWAPAASIPELSQGAPPQGVSPAPGGAMPGVAPVAYLTPTGLTPGDPVYAGFWLRFAAVIIDGILLAIVGFAVNFALGLERPLFLRRPGFQPFQMSVFFAGTLSGIIIEWLYYALMESSKFQGTLGKMALGLLVTDLNGQPIGFGRATGRNFGKLISRYFTLYIGFMMAGWTQQKQALHDMMASCLVLRKQ